MEADAEEILWLGWWQKRWREQTDQWDIILRKSQQGFLTDSM